MAQRLEERGAVEDVADDQVVARLDVAARAREAHQDTHAIARAPRRDRNGGADKPAGAGDQNDVAGIRHGGQSWSLIANRMLPRRLRGNNPDQEIMLYVSRNYG